MLRNLLGRGLIALAGFTASAELHAQTSQNWYIMLPKDVPAEFWGETTLHLGQQENHLGRQMRFAECDEGYFVKVPSHLPYYAYAPANSEETYEGKLEFDANAATVNDTLWINPTAGKLRFEFRAPIGRNGEALEAQTTIMRPDMRMGSSVTAKLKADKPFAWYVSEGHTVRYATKPYTTDNLLVHADSFVATAQAPAVVETDYREAKTVTLTAKNRQGEALPLRYAHIRTELSFSDKQASVAFGRYYEGFTDLTPMTVYGMPGKYEISNRLGLAASEVVATLNVAADAAEQAFCTDLSKFNELIVNKPYRDIATTTRIGRYASDGTFLYYVSTNATVAKADTFYLERGVDGLWAQSPGLSRGSHLIDGQTLLHPFDDNIAAQAIKFDAAGKATLTFTAPVATCLVKFTAPAIVFANNALEVDAFAEVACDLRPEFDADGEQISYEKYLFGGKYDFLPTPENLTATLDLYMNLPVGEHKYTCGWDERRFTVTADAPKHEITADPGSYLIAALKFSKPKAKDAAPFAFVKAGENAQDGRELFHLYETTSDAAPATPDTAYVGGKLVCKNGSAPAIGAGIAYEDMECSLGVESVLREDALTGRSGLVELTYDVADLELPPYAVIDGFSPYSGRADEYRLFQNFFVLDDNGKIAKRVKLRHNAIELAAPKGTKLCLFANFYGTNVPIPLTVEADTTFRKHETAQFTFKRDGKGAYQSVRIPRNLTEEEASSDEYNTNEYILGIKEYEPHASYATGIEFTLLDWPHADFLPTIGTGDAPFAPMFVDYIRRSSSRRTFVTLPLGFTYKAVSPEGETIIFKTSRDKTAYDFITDATGIDTPTLGEEGGFENAAEIYTVDGRRLPALVKGVNLVRGKDGRFVKVIKK